MFSFPGLLVCLVAVVTASQLSLWIERVDPVHFEFVRHPGWVHVFALWRMPREQRLGVWGALGRYDEGLEVLELGGNSETPCPLDDEEMMVILRMVLPGHLDCVHMLFLGFMNSVTDASVQALADRGCGKRLKSVDFRGASCMFLCSSIPFFISRFPFSTERASAKKMQH